MASKADRRRQKRASKDRAKAKARQKNARNKRRASKVRDVQQLADLPEGECFASDNWHEQGPDEVWAAFSRQHPNGMVAAAIFKLNLRDKGVISAELLPELTPSQLEGEIGRRAEDIILASCEPELVVKLVDEAKKLTVKGGGRVPRTVDEATVLFGDILPEDCSYEILTGDGEDAEPPEDDTKSDGGGWMDRLKGLFSGG